MYTNAQLSEVMKKAWVIFRLRRERADDWQIAANPQNFSFSYALKTAWGNCKIEFAKAAALAALNDEDKAKLADLLDARENTKYLPSHMSASRAKNEINDTIKALVGFYI